MALPSRSVALASVVVILLLPGRPGAADDEPVLEPPSLEPLSPEMVAASRPGVLAMRGYVKSLWIRSQEEEPGGVRYVLGLTRLRLDVTAAPLRALELHVEHDTEVRVGSYLDSAEFRRAADPPVPEHWLGIDSNLSRGGDHQVSQRFFRLHARMYVQGTEVTVGRQRIPLGTGRMWSALDVLNPANPLRVERDEYVGVDAAAVEQRVGALTRLLAVYAPAVGGEEDRAVARFQTNARETDLALTAGTYWGNEFVGFDAATQVAGAGVYGELAWTWPPVGAAHAKALVGVAHAPTDTVSFAVEAYATTQDVDDLRVALARNPQLLRIEPPGTRYAGLSITWEPAAVLSGTALVLVNLADGSAVLAPSASWTFARDWVVTAGAQVGMGDGTSEFGRWRALWSAQLQRWF